MTSATVAVVTPTHQRRQALMRVLDGLGRQTCPPGFFSVVVVCDGCTDGTPDMLRNASYPFPLQVVEQWPGRGPAEARNRALTVADAPIVLFLDDDVIPDERLVTVHAAHHAKASDLVVMGPLLPPHGRQQPWIRWEADTLRKQYLEMEAGAWSPTPRQFYTGNASVMKDHLLAAGGFDSRFRRGEDVDLAFRLQQRGLRFVFDPEAMGIHMARRSFASWASAAREYGHTEVAMGPVLGERGLVDVKVLEFKRRHPVIRRIVVFGLANPWWAPLLLAAGRVAGRVFAAGGLWKLARGAYTTIFELTYWRGVIEADGVRDVARELIDRSQRQRGREAQTYR